MRPTAAQLEHHKLVANHRNKGKAPSLAPLIRAAKAFLAARAAAIADSDTVSTMAAASQCGRGGAEGWWVREAALAVALHAWS